jgi:PAP2 superfamily protein
VTEAGSRPARLRWWREVAYVLAFYAVYSFIRNQFGSAAVSRHLAFTHAKDVVSVERFVGLYHEETLQDWFLHWRTFIQFWNIFYGTFHFAVTAFALIWMFRKFPWRYPLWRNTLAITTALALIGFATFPLMPPRLLPEHYGFVDTLEKIGGLWSFDSGAMQKVSNQYAAMPSLHFAWSTWCALVLYPQVRQRWLKVLVVAYPVATLFAIMVTANHFWLDAAGGALILGTGYLLATRLTAWQERRAERFAWSSAAGAR